MTVRAQWDSSYSVGNITLDGQHKRLLSQCNALADCVEQANAVSNSRFHEILHELSSYAREHFTTEEKLLKECAYPGYDEQCQDHADYEEQVLEILSDATSGKLDKVGLQRFLSNWWTQHILVRDIAYRPYLKHK